MKAVEPLHWGERWGSAKIIEQASGAARNQAQQSQCRALNGGVVDPSSREFSAAPPDANCPCQFRWQCPFHGKGKT